MSAPWRRPECSAGWSIWLAKVQVSVIYAVSVLEKLKVNEWLDGSVLYYWMVWSIYTVPDSIGFVRQIFVVPIIAAASAWFTIILEALLAASIVTGYRFRRILLPLGTGFHGAIAVAMGLYNFWLSMSAALIYLLVSPGDRSSLPRARGYPDS